MSSRKLKVEAFDNMYVHYRFGYITVKKEDFERFYKYKDEKKLTFTIGEGRRVWISHDPGSNLVSMWFRKPVRVSPIFGWRGQAPADYITSICANPFAKLFGIKVEEGTCQAIKVSVSG